MDIEQIKQWLNEAEYEAAIKRGDQVPDISVSKKNLITALISVGIPESDANEVVVSMGKAYEVIAQLTQNFDGTILILDKNEASIAPWNNHTARIWHAWVEHGNIQLALILLILCIKCYPENPTTAWGTEHWFYVNCEWHQKHYGIQPLL